MSHPDPEILASIAVGDPVDPQWAGHVQGCQSCNAEVAELTRVLELAQGPAPVLSAPPASVWAGVAAELEASPPAAGPEATTPVLSPVELADRRARRPGAPPRGWSSWWVAAAAVVGLMVGVLGERISTRPEAPTSPTVVSRASLDTLDSKTPRGEADLVRSGSGVSLKVSTQPLPADNGYLEVWLINTDLTRMVSVGVLAPNDADQTFEISQAIIDAGYVIVDISHEQFDDKPQHSGDSLVRGRLA